MTGLEGS